MKKSLITEFMENKLDPSLVEVANMGNWLEARIHSAFTTIADDMFGGGYLTRVERVALSGAIGSALDVFNSAIEEDIPQLYKRRPYDEPATEPSGDINATEGEEGEEGGEADVGEAGQLDGEYVPLLEKSVRQDGTIPIKIIEPGWGSSGYYPAEILKRDGPRVFAEGVKLFWNHPTLTEDVERPERDLTDLAAELVSDARWVPNHPKGAGLYGDAKVFLPYQEAIDELAPHIGVSIRAKGRVTHGKMEGKAGPIVQEITAAKSVDFVTEPGAGGQILQLFEARRQDVHQSNSQKEHEMDEKQVEELKEAHDELEKSNQEQSAELVKLQKDVLLRDAGDYVSEALVKIKLPQQVRVKLVKELSASPPITEGKIDEKAYDEQIKEAVQVELKYLSEVTGEGKITGMGSDGDAPELTDEQAEKQLGKAFARLGLSEAEVKVAVEGR